MSAERQLTVRAIATGFVLGALLAPCNIYTGLKIGFSFNMSVAAALLSYAFWNSLHRMGKTPFWGMLENNINQTTASSSANILSAGLVAPIPALMMLRADWNPGYGTLVIWVFTVSFVGVICALAVRRQLLDRENLPFPNGIATAETIKEMYAVGADALYRVRLLLFAGLAAALVKLIDAFAYKLPNLPPPASWGFHWTNAEGARQFAAWRELWVYFPPSLLLYGFGIIVGPRVGISLALGTVLGWLMLPSFLLGRGWATPPSTEGESWYGQLTEWLLWPGITLMAAAALTSLAISIGKMIWQFVAKSAAKASDDSAEYQPGGNRYVSPKWLVGGFLVAGAAAVLAQWAIFDIPVWLGVIAFVLSFLLAVVAGKVSGETGIPPIGALGKITQVSFGPLARSADLAKDAFLTTNLMSANVTGGAAGQCSDMLHDLKTGKLIGASARAQFVAQLFGILSGSLAGTAAFLVLIPRPEEMLLTEEWPAVPVRIWSEVAVVMAEGLDLPQGTALAVFISIGIGMALAISEALAPARWRKFIPSSSSLGFALIIPAYISLAIFVGSLVRVIAEKGQPVWSAKYLIIIGAGLVAGESLAGVLDSVVSLLQSLLAD